MAPLPLMEATMRFPLINQLECKDFNQLVTISFHYYFVFIARVASKGVELNVGDVVGVFRTPFLDIKVGVGR